MHPLKGPVRARAPGAPIPVGFGVERIGPAGPILDYYGPGLQAWDEPGPIRTLCEGGANKGGAGAPPLFAP